MRDEAADSEQKVCIKPRCPSNQAVQIDGTCQECDPYTYPDVARKSCIADTCTGRSVLNNLGKCIGCGKYEIK